MRSSAGVSLLLLVLATLLLCPPARAQCGYPFQVECDTYIDYDDYNNVVWGYSYTWDWLYYGVGGIGVYVELETPTNRYYD